jgi:hypothetical protein
MTVPWKDGLADWWSVSTPQITCPESDGGRMAPTNMLSSDSHIVEPPDLWSSRLDREYRDRGPAVRQLDGSDWWFIDGRQTMSFVGLVRQGRH